LYVWTRWVSSSCTYCFGTITTTLQPCAPITNKRFSVETCVSVFNILSIYRTRSFCMALWYDRYRARRSTTCNALYVETSRLSLSLSLSVCTPSYMYAYRTYSFPYTAPDWLIAVITAVRALNKSRGASYSAKTTTTTIIITIIALRVSTAYYRRTSFKKTANAQRPTPSLMRP